MKQEADYSLLLRYFLLWYEFILEKRNTKTSKIHPSQQIIQPLPVPEVTQNDSEQVTKAVYRMQPQHSPSKPADFASRALLVRLFRRWRNFSSRRPSRHRLSDPDIISDFVRRLREQIDGADVLEEATQRHSVSHRGSPGHLPSSPGGPPRSRPSSPGGPPRSRPSSPGGSPQPRPASPRGALLSQSPARSGAASDDSIDLCAEIMTTHALRTARVRPAAEAETAAELRRAPHLVTYLMNSSSNRRVRRNAPPPAPAAARPAGQQELESRAELRRQRQEEARRLREERAALTRREEQERLQEQQRSLARERRRELEEFRERRRLQEELRRRRLRSQQILQQKMALAEDVLRRALIRRVFRALLLNVQRSHQLAAAAEERARRALLRASLRRWRHHRALVAAEREQAARHWRRSRLAAWALRRWRLYVHQQHLKAQAAADLSQMQRVQSALRTWQAVLALARVRRRQKMQRAAQCDSKLTCAGALRRWRRLRDALEQERAVEARKDRLRRIVREMLPDFQPVGVGSA